MTIQEAIDHAAVAKAIDRRLRELGWTQQQLAVKANVGLSTVSRIINVKHTGPFLPQTLPALSKALWGEAEWERLDRIAHSEPEVEPVTAFGVMLCIARDRAGLSITQLTERTGIPATRLEALEQGEAAPRMAELDVLREAMDLPDDPNNRLPNGPAR